MGAEAAGLEMGVGWSLGVRWGGQGGGMGGEEEEREKGRRDAKTLSDSNQRWPLPASQADTNTCTHDLSRGCARRNLVV